MTGTTLAVAIAVIAPLFPADAHAHDFWVQPLDYRPRPEAATPLVLQVGHAGRHRRSGIPPARITRFDAVDDRGRSTDLRTGLRPGRTDDGSLRLPAGRYQLVLETDAGALSQLPAARFNAYLEAEGLAPALEHRTRTGTLQAEGLERYGRASKAIVLVGAPPPVQGSGDTWLARPVGLSLEIVLDADPYAAPRPRDLELRVYYQARPLPGALVKLGRLDGGSDAVTLRTDEEGRARHPMPEGGRWLLATVWTRVLPPGSATDYETLFSSLSLDLAATGTGTGQPPRDGNRRTVDPGRAP